MHATVARSRSCGPRGGLQVRAIAVAVAAACCTVPVIGGGPPNDDCAAASTVTNGTYGFTNVGASIDGPIEPAVCNFFGYPQIDSDVWYSYQATCPGIVTVDMCGCNFDTKLAVYATSCPVAAAAIACNDDACGSGGTRSRLSFAVTSGQVYLIRAGGYGGAQGTGSITFSCALAGPVNNDCADAIRIGEGSHPFSTLGATTDGPAEPVCLFLGQNEVSADVWFRYTPRCTGLATASLCGSAFDTRVAVYYGTCPEEPSALVCDDDGCGQQSITAFDVVAWNEYLIRVGGYIGATGNGTLTMSCLPSAPLNDECVNATPVGNGEFLYTNLGATTDGPAEPLCAGNGDDQVGADVWFRYTPPCTANATISVCESEHDTRLAVYGANCPGAAAEALVCNDDACGSPATRSQVTFAATAGSEYLVRVGGHLGATGNGVIRLACDSGVCPFERGDANCDNAVDFFDIDPFLMALFNLPAYGATYCDGALCSADTDCTAVVDFFDIDPFLACLFATCPACP